MSYSTGQTSSPLIHSQQSGHCKDVLLSLCTVASVAHKAASVACSALEDSTHCSQSLRQNTCPHAAMTGSTGRASSRQTGQVKISARSTTTARTSAHRGDTEGAHWRRRTRRYRANSRSKRLRPAPAAEAKVALVLSLFPCVLTRSLCFDCMLRQLQAPRKASRGWKGCENVVGLAARLAQITHCHFNNRPRSPVVPAHFRGSGPAAVSVFAACIAGLRGPATLLRSESGREDRKAAEAWLRQRQLPPRMRPLPLVLHHQAAVVLLR